MSNKLSNKKSIEVVKRNFLNYIKMLDGNKKQLPEHLFNNLFHDKLTGMADGDHITKIHLKEIHSRHFENGCKAKISHLKQVGECSLDVKIRLQNEAGDGHFVRKLITVRDGKVVTLMKYTSSLASLYLQDSSRKLTARPDYYHSGSTVVAPDQRDQIKRFFVEQNAAARQAFQKITIRPKQSCSE